MYRLSKRRTALILSFVYCGLGQIYKGEVLKGIAFVSVWALLILSLFIVSFLPSLLRLLGLSILLLMWFVGMVDAYVDDEILMARKQWLIWQRFLTVLPVAVVFSGILALLVLWGRDFSVTDKHVINDAKAKPIPDGHGLNDTGHQSDSLVFFSVQVGAFKDPGRAEEVYHDLLYKGYTVKIEGPTSPDEGWHRVLVGRFRVEEDAISYMEKLREQGDFSDMVIYRWTAETKPATSP
jgi:hypothetical protein